jgi:hypothetical protein
MKKILCLIMCLTVVLGSTAPVFGETAEAPMVPSIDQIVFTGEPVVLTLDQVLERIMTTGSAIQTAELNKKSDEAIANGYSESYDAIESTLDYMNALSLSDAAALGLGNSVSGVDAKIIQLTKSFARDNLESNYQSELNFIRKSAVQLFYQTLQAQEYYKVAQEDFAAKNATLTNVEKRYNLGSASRLDLLTAKSSMLSSESALVQSFAAYNAARMNFNLQLGYPLMQQVILVEQPQTALDLPIDLTAATASAKELRNEIKVVNFAYEIQETLFKNVSLTTSKNSSVYKKQEVAYLQAKQSASQISSQMEMDVKIKFMGIVQKRFALYSAENTVALAKESFRISQLTYNAGMSTLAELQSAEVRYNQAKLARIAADTDYALALYDFEYAKGVGTVRLNL